MGIVKAGILGLQAWLMLFKSGGSAGVKPRPGGTRPGGTGGSNVYQPIYAGFPVLSGPTGDMAYGLGLVVLILFGVWAVDKATEK